MRGVEWVGVEGEQVKDLGERQRENQSELV